MRKTPFVLAATLATVMLSGSLAAKPALKDVAHVSEGLITVGIAYEISERCGSIDARFFRGIAYLNDLKRHAQSLGYTNAEIDAFVDDREEKRRLEGIARERLIALGAVEGDAASFCAVGRTEMANGTPIGRLLR